MRKLLLILSSFFLAGISSTSFADACNAQICICPGNVQIQYGQYCPSSNGDSDYIQHRGWSSYSNAQPRSANEIIADAKAQGYGFTKAGYLYELGANEARRKKLADDNGKKGLIYARYPAKAYNLQAEYIAAMQQGNKPPASNKAPIEKTNEWTWVKVAYNNEMDVFVEKSSLTYNPTTKIANALIKMTPFSCSAASSDKSCYVVMDYQFSCDKKQEAGTRTRTYSSKTNQLLSDRGHDLRYRNIDKGSLMEHAATAVCAAGAARK